MTKAPTQPHQQAASAIVATLNAARAPVYEGALIQQVGEALPEMTERAIKRSVAALEAATTIEAQRRGRWRYYGLPITEAVPQAQHKANGSSNGEHRSDLDRDSDAPTRTLGLAHDDVYQRTGTRKPIPDADAAAVTESASDSTTVQRHRAAPSNPLRSLSRDEVLSYARALHQTEHCEMDETDKGAMSTTPHGVWVRAWVFVPGVSLKA